MKNYFKKSNCIKNIFSIIVVSVLVSVFSITFIACGRIINGSGNVITEDREVSGFNKVSVSGSGNLYIEQGDVESLTIEAEDNIIPLIEAEVSGNTLKISFKPGTRITTNKSIKFHLTVKELKKISGSGSGGIYCGTLNADDLNIDTSGSRKVEMSDLETKNIEIHSSGSSDITLTGSTDRQDIKTSGSVKFNGEDFKSETCLIDSSGSGELIVNVSDDLDINASGSVKIIFIGNPSISQKISGSASISSR